MAVVFDAASSAVVNQTSGTSLSITNITVGSGSNRALFLLIIWATGVLPTVTGANWDATGTPQAMSLVAGANGASGASSTSVAVYSLAAPTSGAKTLTISWSSA